MCLVWTIHAFLNLNKYFTYKWLWEFCVQKKISGNNTNAKQRMAWDKLGSSISHTVSLNLWLTVIVMLQDKLLSTSKISAIALKQYQPYLP